VQYKLKYYILRKNRKIEKIYILAGYMGVQNMPKLKNNRKKKIDPLKWSKKIF